MIADFILVSETNETKDRVERLQQKEVSEVSAAYRRNEVTLSTS